MKGLKDFWKTWILGALLPVYVVTTFVATLARVNGDSMQPTLHSGQMLLLLKYPRWLNAWGLSKYLHHGDLIIFKAPAGSPYSYEKIYGLSHRPYNIKRVIALEGETVEIRDGKLFINAKAVAESYAGDGYMNAYAAQVVPKGKVWVLGDNRKLGDSLDSRAYGMVSIIDIAGTANLSIFPLKNNN